ncbi:MAG: hypothetical protein GDA43_05775 [Hormoscilla sp. SP5CHS1]|nr:hypothetical protein [Hormoscilla sp. SP12CHS1]MBC6452765.1 hypothetical protein [Hormoscilla sp. SP5CHS1]MBC6471912.1 hypothetical protein [Hormoscilla sp. GM102CHS1]
MRYSFWERRSPPPFLFNFLPEGAIAIACTKSSSEISRELSIEGVILNPG